MSHQIHSFLPMSNATPQSILDCMSTATLTIRPAYADDEVSIRRLAAIDSTDPPPASPLLVGEVDGQLRVALSLSDGSVIADPFFPTAAVISLMRRHAKSMATAQRSAGTGTVRLWRRGRRVLAGLQGAGAHSA